MSASCEPLVFQTTQRCHSVFSCRCPLWSFQVRLVAREKVATRLPPVVERTSGSFPRFPIRVTLFKLRLTYASWARVMVPRRAQYRGPLRQPQPFGRAAEQSIASHPTDMAHVDERLPPHVVVVRFTCFRAR